MDSETETEDELLNGSGFVALLIFFVIGIIILIGYIYLLQISYSKGNKYLKNLISTVPINNAFFWKLSHLILFFFLGIFFPQSDLIVIGIGIIWELIEHNLGLTLPKVPRYKNGKSEQIQWWHGDLDDIVIDVFGYYVGKAVFFSLKDIQDIDIWEVGLK